MAQTGFTPIQLYASGTATNVPLATNLTNSTSGAELAINYFDGKLYYKDASGVVQLLASKATSVNVASFSGGTTGLLPNTATTGAVTLSGILTVPNGGTGLTSLTSGYIPYGNGTGAFSSSSALTFNGTTLSTSNDASISGLTVGKGGGAISSNTAVGASALLNNTTGTSNLASGTSALQSNTTGSGNTASGATALFGNTTGTQNSAFGGQAIYSNTTGSNNIAVGYSSLFSNTTASNNTAVGYQAGYYITTGSKNSIIGSYNGNQGGLDIRTASNYIVLSDGDGNPQVAAYQGGTLSLANATPKAGTGITFPATQSASSDANTLDDYEEGTFTPTWANVTIGNGNVLASYTKVGNLVSVQIILNWGSTTSLSGGLSSVSGLPFVIKNQASQMYTTGVAVFLRQNVGWFTGSVSGNGGNTNLNQVNVSGGASIISATNPITWGAGDYFATALTYQTT